MRATLLPYSGGKKPMYSRYIFPYLQALYENGYRTMRSPFMGGGYAELGWVLDFEDTTLDASDLNGDVVSFYQTLLDPKQSKKFYSDLERIPITATTTLRWIKENVANKNVRFYLVQKLAFQSFASSNGRISSVKYEQYKRMMKDNVLRELIKEIQQRRKHISIRQENVFVRSSFPTDKKTFLFLDPPYYYNQDTKNERYGLQHYYYEGHKEFDHVKFAKMVKKAKVPFLLFYNDDPTIRTMYDDCEIVPYTFRGKDEILITNISIYRTDKACCKCDQRIDGY